MDEVLHEIGRFPFIDLAPAQLRVPFLEGSFSCWCSAGTEGITSIKHPLFLYIRESPGSEHRRPFWK